MIKIKKNKQIVMFIFVMMHVITMNAHILEYIKSKMPENCVILEAGSYDGLDTEKMATLLSKSTIYTFEPVPELFNRTINRINKYKNVYPFNLALSDQNGTAKFYSSNNSENFTVASGSLYEPKDHLIYYPDVLFDRCIEVKTVNLDDWCQANNIDHIDFMWLDMQGAELKVLQSAPKILKTVQYIWTEVAVVQTYHNIPLSSEICSWLDSQGFMQILVQPTSMAEANILFGRNK